MAYMRFWVLGCREQSTVGRNSSSTQMSGETAASISLVLAVGAYWCAHFRCRLLHVSYLVKCLFVEHLKYPNGRTDNNSQGDER
jgi:hypothetical protein